MLKKIPEQVINVLNKLSEAGYEAFIVGGCVRDLIMDRTPKDWDVTTNARPEETLKLFPDSFYENEFGTVGVKVEPLLPIVSGAIKISKEQKKISLKIAKSYLAKIECPVHDWKHAESVAHIALDIAQVYPEVNQDFLELAAYFHDAGRANAQHGEGHILESQKIVKSELEKVLGKGITKILAEAVNHARGKSESLEQEIIKEADKIDGISEWRIKEAIEKNVTEHIEWLTKDYVNVIPRIFLKPAVAILNGMIPIANQRLEINLPIINSPKAEVIEVTTYRIESKYSDRRRPDEVKFAKTLEEDLSRRDFTMNAVALKLKAKSLKLKAGFEIVDLFGGQEDMKKKIIRTVGDAHERFDEDALRMMRAVRFHAELGFAIEKKTLEAIKKNAKHLAHIALERIKDELARIILSDNPAEGVDMLHETGLLAYIIPELEKGVGVAQNRHHVYTIYKHSILALKHCPSQKLEVRLAALLHDIAKPQTKRGEGYYSTFYNHDHVGARVAEKILTRLRFSNEMIQKVRLLVDNHMFYYNPEEVGESSVRRLIQKVGLENMKDLMDVRIADRLGSGVPKAMPYKLRHFEYVVEKVSQDAVSVKMLKINGNDLMKDLKLKPGPKIGAILDVLLAEVIEDANKNEKAQLLARAKELDREDLDKLRKLAKVKIEEKKEEDDQEIKSKHWVK